MQKCVQPFGNPKVTKRPEVTQTVLWRKKNEKWAAGGKSPRTNATFNLDVGLEDGTEFIIPSLYKHKENFHRFSAWLNNALITPAFRVAQGCKLVVKILKTTWWWGSKKVETALRQNFEADSVEIALNVYRLFTMLIVCYRCLMAIMFSCLPFKNSPFTDIFCNLNNKMSAFPPQGVQIMRKFE